MRLLSGLLLVLFLASSSTSLADKFDDRVAHLDIQSCVTVRVFFSNWMDITYYKTGNNEALKFVALKSISRQRVENGLLNAPAEFADSKKKIKQRLNDIGFTGVTRGDRLILEKVGGQSVLAYDYGKVQRSNGRRGKATKKRIIGELDGLDKGIFEATLEGLQRKVSGWHNNCPR